MPRPVFRHCRHQPLDVNSFSRLPLCGVISPPRSISDDRHEDESSKLELRRVRWKQPQLRSISPMAGLFYGVRYKVNTTLSKISTFNSCADLVRQFRQSTRLHLFLETLPGLTKLRDFAWFDHLCCHSGRPCWHHFFTPFLHWRRICWRSVFLGEEFSSSSSIFLIL